MKKTLLIIMAIAVLAGCQKLNDSTKSSKRMIIGEWQYTYNGQIDEGAYITFDSKDRFVFKYGTSALSGEGKYFIYKDEDSPHTILHVAHESKVRDDYYYLWELSETELTIRTLDGFNLDFVRKK